MRSTDSSTESCTRLAMPQDLAAVVALLPELLPQQEAPAAAWCRRWRSKGTS